MYETDSSADRLDLPGAGHIAYRTVAGRSPGIIFLGGYASDMNGTKATFLDEWCRRHDRAFLRFDYQGHGSSSGQFADGTISSWTRDACRVLDKLTEGPQILVGSSMGGWIMLNLVSCRSERIHALVGIAAAPDFSQYIWWSLDAAERERLDASGVHSLGDGLVVTRDFIADGRKNNVMRGEIDIDVPVRLLHGMEDTSVPWQTTLDIAQRLGSRDVEILLVKDGDHRLSRDRDLERLGSVLEELVAQT